MKHWNGRSAEDECASRDTGVQRSKINKYSMVGSVWGVGDKTDGTVIDCIQFAE